MNDMILANAKQANDTGNAASNAVLGKRPRSEAGEEANAESEPQKRRKK